ncbi:MAG TPA: SCO family protein [Ktedonobacterales bacterium]|jgi:protein SCO1/2|nr:SCO family protein [Ktedonobacterales bacterium]
MQETQQDGAQPVGRKLRPWLLVALALLVVAAATVVVVRAKQPPAPKLQGYDLGSVPAPAFTLRDQTGQTVSLQGLQGKPVVVTFLYTHCPDVCPLTADKLHKAATMLGKSADNAAWLAISVDPLGDTPVSATQFVATHQLAGKLHFLLGTSEQLSPIWKNYAILVQSQLNQQQDTNTVMHSFGVYLLDKSGHQRIYMDDGFDPAAVAADLRILLAE